METSPYKPVIQKWEEMDSENFLGNGAESGLVYTLGITPPDPTDRNYVLINVFVEKEYRNITKALKPFEARVYYCFRVKNEGKSISPEFYYELIKYASNEFILLLKSKAKHPPLKFHMTGIQSFQELEGSIRQVIDTWDKLYKRTSLN